MNIPAAAETWNPSADTVGVAASLPASFEEACLAGNHERELRRSANPPLAILGVLFDNVTTEQTIRAIVEMVASRRPHYLVTCKRNFVRLRENWCSHSTTEPNSVSGTYNPLSRT